jgi:general stress protein YciG
MSGNEKSKRGFAAMTPEQRREIAAKGGRTAHAKGVAHRWTSDEASAAGRIGGVTVSADREHMAEIGARGGRKPSVKCPDCNGKGGWWLYDAWADVEGRVSCDRCDGTGWLL